MPGLCLIASGLVLDLGRLLDLDDQSHWLCALWSVHRSLSWTFLCRYYTCIGIALLRIVPL